MRIVEWAASKPYSAAALAGCLLGLVIGLAWPVPDPAPSNTEGLSASVPSRATMQRYSEADFSTIRDGDLWSGSAGGQQTSAKLSNWKLRGVLLRPVHAAMVEAEKKQVRVVVGDALPDGAILQRVSADYIEFTRKRCTYRRPLYSSDDIPLPSTGCSATPAEGTKKRARRK